MDRFQRSCDAMNTAVGYIQSMRVAEIRQTLDFLGVHHTEVIVGLCMFVLIQFTKFTGVLLIAIAIAFAIFYMWDTYFPEISQRQQRPHTEYEPAVPYLELFRPDYHDARTSARLPPFANTSSNNSDQDFYGDQTGLKDNVVTTTYSSPHDTPPNSRNLMIPMVRSNLMFSQTTSRATELSGLTTPLGHLSSMSSQAAARRAKSNAFSKQGNQSEDRPSYRRSSNNERDHMSHRSPGASYPENRSSRNMGVPQSNRNPAMYQDDSRSRRPTGSSMYDEGKPSRNRRSSKDRPSNKRQLSHEMEYSRGYERRPYTTAAGPASNRNSVSSGGTYYGRSNSNNRNNMERQPHHQRDSQTLRNSRSPNYSGNNTPNRNGPSRRNTNS